jgi:bilin biosynthesis protein
MTQDALFAQLKHPNPYLRDRAMLEIFETQDETTIPHLMQALDDEDVVYRRSAVKALGMMGFNAVQPLVEALTHSDNVTVRGSAAKALAQIALNYPEEPFPVEGLEGLRAGLQDDNPVVHIGSAMALGEIGQSALDILIQSLQATDNLGLAVSIVNALASVGDRRSAEVLAALIEDESTDAYVRETATSALSRIEFVRNNQPK